MGLSLNDVVSQATSIISESRFVMGIRPFMETFLSHWAFLHTGLYPAEGTLSNELNNTAARLSHLLSTGMKAHPADDVLGHVLAATGFSHKGLSFYPTPPGLSQLICSITDPGAQNYYEPCCGTGSIALKWMERKIREGKFPHAEITLEDKDPLMVKACLLQIIHFLDAHSATPAVITLNCVDSITREFGSIKYQLFQQTPMLAR